MSCFACIYFSETNILLSKVDFVYKTFMGVDAYEVYVPTPRNEMTDRAWEKLEYQLQGRDIEYVVMRGKENPFETIQLITGEELRRSLGGELLHYIYKYKLIDKPQMYANVGIIAGRIDESLEVAMSLVDEVTSLTFFMNDPIVYKEVISEIYSNYRLKAKAKVPCSTNLREMDVIFDLVGNYNYAKWCKPTAIYIDFKDYIGRKAMTFKGVPPIIWNDFDIICERQRCEMRMLQASLYAQGIFKSSFKKTFKRMNISIDTVYNTRIS
ncbi:MAG: hypothetical protein ACRCWY_10105 [Cellulosilyticaceae bacterium]